MRLFNFFKKKVDLTESQRKWNKMWELWAEGQVDSPHAELMTYICEINNGGHSQYFSNVENTGDLQEEMSTLENILSTKQKNNLRNAYKAYLVLEKNVNDKNAEEIIAECDVMFYTSEKELNRILENYAAKIEI